MVHKLEVKQGVITDLLPLFLSKEASLDTNTLMEEYLAREPEFARTILALRESFHTLDTLEEPIRSQAEQMQEASFERTRKAVRRDNILLGCGIAYLIAPFSFLFSGTHVTWFMMRNNPLQAAFFLLAGIICLLLRMFFKRRGDDWVRHR